MSEQNLTLRDAAANAQNVSDTEQHLVWIDKNWYLPVDNLGYVLGACAEGALGYIVQLKPSHNQHQDARAALKLPRLRAETLQENAYIAQILEAEAAAVAKANVGAHTDGLIAVHLGGCGTLRGRRELRDAGIDSMEAQDGCIPFISFGRDNRLRICNLKFEAEKNGSWILKTFPDTSEVLEEFRLLSEDIWKALSGKSKSSGVPQLYFGKSVYLARGSEAEESSAQRKAPKLARIESNLTAQFGPLTAELSPSRFTVVWYAGVPSIMFRWAYGTLQMGICRGEHKKWTLRNHYSLVRRVLTGLVTLHSQNIVHGDVRPANVMALESLSDAEHYALTDYGSFATDQPAPSEHEASGLTTPPGITRHRASTFYARERRAGVEREDADVAVILTKTSIRNCVFKQVRSEDLTQLSDDEYFLRLDWKRHIVKPETNELEPERLEEMVQDWLLMAGPTKAFPESSIPMSPWGLHAGDQVRVREYVFKIIDVDERETHTNLRCSRRYARVLMEKISVYGDSDLLPALDPDAPIETSASRGTCAHPCALVIDLPRWVEIRQTSVASDLYSAGVMALYSFYAGALWTVRQRQPIDEVLMAELPDGQFSFTQPTDPSRAGAVYSQPQDLEHNLAAIVRRLEDENNFKHLWKTLSEVCSDIEIAFVSHRSAKSLLSDIRQRELLEEDESLTVSRDPSVTFKQITFQDDVKDLVSAITSMSPEMKQILLLFNNAAHFLFFIHFVLSCIHRKSHGIDEQFQQKFPKYPFCVDRFERTTKSEAAKAALERAKVLDGYLDPTHKFFKDFGRELALTLKEDNTGSDFQLRQLINKLRSTLEQSKKKGRESRLLLQSSTHDLEKATATVKSLADLLAKTKEEVGTAEGKFAAERAKFEQLQRVLADASESIRKQKIDINKLMMFVEDVKGLIKTIQESSRVLFRFPSERWIELKNKYANLFVNSSW